MPKLGTASSQRTSALVRLFEDSRGRDRERVVGVTSQATLTRFTPTSEDAAAPGASPAGSELGSPRRVLSPSPLPVPPLSPTPSAAAVRANMVFNYSEYEQQVIGAGSGAGTASSSSSSSSTDSSSSAELTDSTLDSTLNMGKGLTNGHGPPPGAPPPPPKPPKLLTNGVLPNGQHRTPSFKSKDKDKPPKVLKKPSKEPVKIFHMNGFSQEGHVALDDASCTFVGSRNMMETDTLREHKIVSSKGTVRGFKNRVRAGIATFIDQEHLMVSKAKWEK